MTQFIPQTTHMVVQLLNNKKLTPRRVLIGQRYQKYHEQNPKSNSQETKISIKIRHIFKYI